MAVGFDEEGKGGEVEAVEETGESFGRAGLDVVDADGEGVDVQRLGSLELGLALVAAGGVEDDDCSAVDFPRFLAR